MSVKTKQTKSKLIKRMNKLAALMFVFVIFLCGFNTIKIVTGNTLGPDVKPALPDIELATGGTLDLWGKQNGGSTGNELCELKDGKAAIDWFNKEYLRAKAAGGIVFDGTGVPSAKASYAGIDVEAKGRIKKYVEEDAAGNVYTDFGAGAYEVPSAFSALSKKIFWNESYVDAANKKVTHGFNMIGAIEKDENGLVKVVKKGEIESFHEPYEYDAYIDRFGDIPSTMYTILNNDTAEVTNFIKHEIKGYLNGYTVSGIYNAKGTEAYKNYIAKFFMANKPYKQAYMTFSFTLNRYGQITSFSTMEEGLLTYHLPEYLIYNLTGKVKYEQNYAVKYMPSGFEARKPVNRKDFIENGYKEKTETKEI